MRLYFPLGFRTGSIAQVHTDLYSEKLACSPLITVTSLYIFCLFSFSMDAHGLSLVVARGTHTLVAEHRLLTVVPSLTAEHGL